MKISVHQQPGGEFVASVVVSGRCLRVCSPKSFLPERTRFETINTLKNWLQWERGKK